MQSVDKLAPLSRCGWTEDLLRCLRLAGRFPLSHMLPRPSDLVVALAVTLNETASKARRNSGDKCLHGDVSSRYQKQFRCHPHGFRLFS